MFNPDVEQPVLALLLLVGLVLLTVFTVRYAWKLSAARYFAHETGKIDREMIRRRRAGAPRTGYPYENLSETLMLVPGPPRRHLVAGLVHIFIAWGLALVVGVFVIGATVALLSA